MSQNIIEINGKRYDALSGKLLGDEPTVQRPLQTNSLNSNGPQVMDGFIKPKPASAHKRAVSSRAVHSKTSRSKTLMRGAVKKPIKAESQHANKNYTVFHPVANHKHDRAAHLDNIRAGRAATVQKSTLVSKFGEVANNVTKRVEPLPVKSAPSHHAPPLHTVSTPIDKAGRQIVPESANPFDLALQNADAHTLPRTKKPSFRQRTARKLSISPRALNIAAGVFITLFAGGLIAYHNIPQLAIRLASARAGVRANLPSYQPSGFSMNGPVQYSGGVVTLNYESNSDDRNFKVVQKTTDWNSQTLLENFVATKTAYQTFQDKGRTVYVYEGSNATWVSGGVWYQIEGESDLSSDQLRRIVSGL